MTDKLKQAIEALEVVRDFAFFRIWKERSDLPKYIRKRLNEVIADLRSIEPQTVSTGDVTESERAPIQRIVYFHKLDTLADMEAMINELVLLFRASHHPVQSVPSVEELRRIQSVLYSFSSPQTEYTFGRSRVESVNAAIDLVSNLLSRQSQPRTEEVREWIPVTERLPDHNKPVLCIAAGRPYTASWYSQDRMWYQDGPNSLCRNPTHWQPLPAPPALAKLDKGGE